MLVIRLQGSRPRVQGLERMNDLKIRILALQLQDLGIGWSKSMSLGQAGSLQEEWHAGPRFVLNDEVIFEQGSLELCQDLLVQVGEFRLRLFIHEESERLAP